MISQRNSGCEREGQYQLWDRSEVRIQDSEDGHRQHSEPESHHALERCTNGRNHDGNDNLEWAEHRREYRIATGADRNWPLDSERGANGSGLPEEPASQR